MHLSIAPPLAAGENSRESLPEVHGTVAIPRRGGFWRRLLAFAGPAYMISVGYMDPGNWATDIQGGSKLGYELVWVLFMSNLMAILLQTLSARLGVVTGRDLAQACRESYPRAVTLALWVLCEIAIAACDLAEVLGTAIGLNLLFGLNLMTGVVLTALDVFLLLGIQRLGIRKMEAFIVLLIGTVGACFAFEIFLARPDWIELAQGFVPRIRDAKALYLAIAILGATVMPHNLYLHSSLVQTRAVEGSSAGRTEGNRFNLIDSVVALMAAFFVNLAILVLAAATFHRTGQVLVEGQEWEHAHRLLTPILGTSLASSAFAVALLCAGQSSTLTGTLAGQIVMEGFLDLRIRPWLRRLFTRTLAIAPAVFTIAWWGDGKAMDLLVLSQVVLSLQLPFAVIPLVRFTGDREKMGEFASPRWLRLLAWATAGAIVALNGWLTYDTVREWLEGAAHPGWILGAIVPVVLFILALLAYVTLAPILTRARETPPSLASIAAR